ncbi:helix-turn-helix domain-containing protein [Methylobacterium sp. J-068]|uniref:helix-turn-helix domain-containing protein n=1 Tax=Methylobacterium sp. J-068 TaxID=2836649 RepID=UPI001FB94E29|nr:helix-turn-helix domain-containing protein [Methylobacterium sp. J-068]MCJ2035767.1 helix-turn-helix domain-containing protein [Methylobacterium sp. J-068]
MNPNALLPREVAARWGCSEQHVRNMVNRGDLGHYRLGGKLLIIPLSAVEEVERAVWVQREPPKKKDSQGL